MPAPSRLQIATSSLERLLKEESSYHKELEQGKARVQRLESEKSTDDNAEYMIRQEVLITIPVSDSHAENFAEESSSGNGSCLSIFTSAHQRGCITARAAIGKLDAGTSDIVTLIPCRVRTTRLLLGMQRRRMALSVKRMLYWRSIE